MTENIAEFPGTPLSEKDFEQNKTLYNLDKLNGKFAWDTGIAIGRYLEALKDGVILGAHCNTCVITVVPPRTVCEWCFQPMNDLYP